MSDLKPCPFCGGKAELQDDIGREDKMFYRAVCSDIECQGHYCNDWSMTQGRAIERWNTRAERTCEMVYEPDDPPIHYGKWTCSECGHWWMYPPYDMSGANYCPDCGAKVERGES